MTSKQGDPYLCTCWFGASDHSPTMAVLQLGIDHDEGLKRLELVYELRIVPAFLAYEQHDRLVVDFLAGRNGSAERIVGGRKKNYYRQAA